MEDKYIVALEIGSSRITGALASIDARRDLNILAVQTERLVDSVRYGQVKNVEEVARAIDAIFHKLANARAVQPRRITSAYVGLSGASVGAAKAGAAMSFADDTEITADIVEQLRRQTLSDYQAEKDVYDVAPCEYVVDNETTLNPVGRVGRKVQATFNVIQGNPSLRANINRVLPERLKVSVNGFIVSAIAQANAVLTPEEKRLGVMFVDFGAETTTVAVYKGGVLRSLVTLPMGSRNITRDLTALNYLEEKAEDIKRSVGVTNPSDSSTPQITNQHVIDQPEINHYIQARAGEIAANVVAQVEFAGYKPAELSAGMVIVGGGARLKGFSDLLAETSKMKVRMGVAPRTILISDSSVRSDDVIDVISLLQAISADKEAKSCLSEPEILTPPTPQRTPSDYIRGREPEDDHSNESRIGREDDFSLDDDDDDFDKPKKSKEKSRKPKKSHSAANDAFDDDEDDDNFTQTPRKSKPSWLERFRGRMTNLINDSEEEDAPFND